jgi:hypothetical protein
MQEVDLLLSGEFFEGIAEGGMFCLDIVVAPELWTWALDESILT